MTYRGVYRDGIVVLQGDIDLQNGAPVEVNLARSGRAKTGATTPKSKRPARSSAKARASSGKASAAHPLPGFGAWKHRGDIDDTAAFARALRKRTSKRESRD